LKLSEATDLDRPFRGVGEAIELRKRVTLRAMWRSNQDLARAAEMKDLVTRAISGQATEQMQQHYGTVDQTEMRQGIAKIIISLAGVREAMGAGGMEVVCVDARNENGQVGSESQTGRRTLGLSFFVGVEGIEPSTSTV
jgi:hypothetical protein